jgi:hypothetical protein
MTTQGKAPQAIGLSEHLAARVALLIGYIGNPRLADIRLSDAVSTRLTQHRKDGRRRTDLNRIDDLEAVPPVKGSI